MLVAILRWWLLSCVPFIAQIPPLGSRQSHPSRTDLYNSCSCAQAPLGAGGEAGPEGSLGWPWAPSSNKLWVTFGHTWWAAPLSASNLGTANPPACTDGPVADQASASHLRFLVMQNLSCTLLEALTLSVPHKMNSDFTRKKELLFRNYLSLYRSNSVGT